MVCCVRRLGKQWIIFFFNCPIALILWHKLFGLARIDLAPPQSVVEMLTIFYWIFGGLLRGESLWHIANLTLI